MTASKRWKLPALFLLLAAFGIEAPEAADDPVWLLCQLEEAAVVCTESSPMTQISGRHLVPINRPPPLYPQRLRNRGLEGCVGVAFSVDLAGRTTDIKVLETVHQGQFDEAAASAVREYRFFPAGVVLEGIAVRVCFSLR